MTGIMSFHMKPPGSGVPVAGIMLESNPSTSNAHKHSFRENLLIILIFQFFISLAQNILTFLILFIKTISALERFLIPKETTFTFLKSKHLLIAHA